MIGPMSVAALLGLAVGWLLERSHFCTMGAISDAYLFGSLRRLRSWLLAMATALLLTQALAALGLVPLDATPWLARPLAPLALLVGGLLFGIGMVMAGGCASRNLVRLGTGSLKALVVVLVLGLTALATAGGILAWPADLLLAASAGPDRSLGDLLAGGSPAGAWALDLFLALLVGGGLLLWIFRDPGFRRNRADQMVGFGLGLAVALGFLATGTLFFAPGGPGEVVSLNFAAPLADALAWGAMGRGTWPGFGAALVLGTVAGAALSAGSARRARIETFASRDDMIRHVAGAGLMGFGGMLAMGCTIGQGVSGIATLAPGSFLALAGIVLGALLALRRLEQGSWRGAIGWGGGRRLEPAERV
ncbi:MAG: YeeE/YedE family protein [Geminicoccaceae bacterium]